MPSKLADLLCGHFEKGLVPDAPTMDYIDSTFGVSDAKGLSEILAAASGGEAETLIELLLFPDLDLQILLEDFLAGAGFGKADEARVIEEIHRRRPRVRLDLGSGRGSLFFEIDASAASTFIPRLHIANSPHPQLVRAIDAHAGEALKGPLKVALRNSRLSFSEARISFLCRLISGIGPRTDADAAPILFCPELLQELAEDADADAVWEHLVFRKQYLTHLLERAADYERKLLKSNMETLILQGGRMPHIDVADTGKKIGMIDGIAWAVYGKFIPAPEEGQRMEISAEDIRSIPY